MPGKVDNRSYEAHENLHDRSHIDDNLREITDEKEVAERESKANNDDNNTVLSQMLA